MPWGRFGDNAATYPHLMQVAALSDADERTVNEVAGFLWRCAGQSAGHMTDYHLDLGTVMMMGGPTRWKTLVAQCIRTGLLTRLPGRQGFKLLEDPEFIHIRLREAVLRDRARDRDRKNPDLTMPVLARDGDQCRYCGVSCNSPHDQKSNRSRQFDSRDRHRATTVDTYVVACKGCNRRRDALRVEGMSEAEIDAVMPLLAPPERPYFHPKTAERLEAHFGRPFVSGPVPEDPVSGPDRRSIGDRPSGSRDGSGRDRAGQGRDGTGRSGSVRGERPPRRRGSRGSRGGGGS